MNNINSEKNNALKELNSLNKLLKKDRWKKLFIFLIVFGIFKLTIGSLNINNLFVYPASKSRLYDVSLNNKSIASEYFIHHRFPIIPFILYFNSYYSDTESITGDADITYNNKNKNERVLLSIDSYSCFCKETQVRCNPKNKTYKMILNKDTKYTNLYIIKNGRPDKEMYNGPMIDDITDYISQKGYYYVEITAKYSLFLKVTISFNIHTT